LKEHLAGKCGNISRCSKCRSDIQNYFLRELQRVQEWKKAIKEEMFHRVQNTMPLSDDEDEELQETVEVSRHEAEFQRRAGERYEHGGRSETGGGGGRVGVRGFFRRVMSHRERSRDLDAAKATTHVQTRIDTGPWTSKGKSAKEAIGRAWSKWFHISGIPDRNTDNPYLF
jgi:hypothetical protein